MHDENYEGLEKENKLISMDLILDRYYNNTVYANEPILILVQIVMSLANPMGVPLTLISSKLGDMGSDKLAYYYAPHQLEQDAAIGMFNLDTEEFKKAKNGVVRVKLNYEISAESFTKTLLHEYIHVKQYLKNPEKMIKIDVCPPLAEEKEKEAYAEVSKIWPIAIKYPMLQKSIRDLDDVLNWRI